MLWFNLAYNSKLIAWIAESILATKSLIHPQKYSRAYLNNELSARKL